MNNQRYIVLAFLTGAAILGGSVRGIAVPMLARFDLGDPLVLGVMNATTLLAILVTIVAFLGLMRHGLSVEYTDEVVSELRKVVWPDREETVRSSGIVLGVTLVIAGALAGYDYVWAQITKVFLFTDG